MFTKTISNTINRGFFRQYRKKFSLAFASIVLSSSSLAQTKASPSELATLYKNVYSELDSVMTRYLGRQPFNLSVQLDATNAKDVATANEVLPGFPAENTESNQDVRKYDINISLGMEKPSDISSVSELTTVIKSRLSWINISNVNLKIQKMVFPKARNLTPNPDFSTNSNPINDDLKKDFNQFKGKVEESLTQLKERKQESTPFSQSNGATKFPWLEISLLLLGSIIAVWLLLRNLGNNFAQKLANNFGPVLNQNPTPAQNSLGQSRDQNNLASLPSTSGATAFSQTMSDLEEQISNHQEGFKLLVQGFLRTENWSALFLILSAVDDSQRQAIRALMSENQSQQYTQFVSEEARDLVNNELLCQSIASEIFRVLLLCEQNADSLMQTHIEQSFASLGSDHQHEFLTSLNRTEMKTFAKRVGIENIISTLANDKAILDEVIDTLSDKKLKEADLEQLDSKIQPFLSPSSQGKEHRTFKLVASLPVSMEGQYDHVLTRSPSSFFFGNFQAGVDLISQLSIDECGNFLSCYDEEFQTRVFQSMPEIKARRIANRVPAEATKQGMILKGKILEQLKSYESTSIEGNEENELAENNLLGAA